MIRAILFTCCLFCACSSVKQFQSYEEEISYFQQEMDESYRDPDTSPLSEEKREKFTGHKFFPVNKTYRVKAKLVRVEDPVAFEMKTSTDRLPLYEKYAEAYFELDGEEHKLSIYQSQRLREKSETKDYLFLPFTDLTTGVQTYGGGRYIDLSITPRDSIVVDFNKAYNPYCAYSGRYSCPIPPKENDLEVEILAGIKLSEDDNH